MKESNQQRAAKILKPYRRQLDVLDNQILKLLGKRFGIIRKVAKTKAKYELPAYLHDRVQEVRNSRMAQGKKYGINEALVYILYSAIIFESCGMEDEIKAQLTKKEAQVSPLSDSAPDSDGIAARQVAFGLLNDIFFRRRSFDEAIAASERFEELTSRDRAFVRLLVEQF